MKNLIYSFRQRILSGFYLTVFALNVTAQTSIIEEVVVTAQKRGEASIQDIPISIQAISGDQLIDVGAQEFMDIAPMISSLQFQDFGPGDREYILRGINSKGPSAVGVYYDEAVITARNAETGGGRNVDIRLYDLSHIEVLKGPQGTLYGANSMSGTIRFITNKPDVAGFDSYISTELSDTHKGDINYNVNGMLNIPVTDKLAVRAVGWYLDNDGYIDALRSFAEPRENINSEEVLGTRISARWLATDRLTLNLQYTYQELDSEGSSRFTPADATPFDATPIDPALAAPAGCDLCNFDLTYNPWKEDAQIYSATAEYITDFGSFVAASSLYHRDISFNHDNTPILLSFGVPLANNTEFIQDQDIWSSEVRFASDWDGPAQIVVGGFYNLDDLNFAVDVAATDITNGRKISDCILFQPGRDIFTGTGPNVFCRRFDTEIKQFAFFGELNYEFTDKLSGTAGIRYFDSELESVQRTTHPFFGNVGGVGDFFASTIQNSKSNKTTWKFNLSYQYSEQLLAYVTVSEGFRIGGVNRSPAIPGVPFFSDYRPDVLRNYEIGVKTELLDGRLHFNGAVYWLDWTDIQQIFTDPVFAFEFITNQGDARIQGLELELTAQLSEDLRLQAGGSYQHARLTSDGFIPVGGDPRVQPLDGNDIPNVPRFQGSAALIYSRPLTTAIGATYRLDLSYRDDVTNAFNSADPGLLNLDEYFLLNLRAILDYENWTLTAFIRNVTDERAQIDGVNFNLFPTQITTIRPRTFGASLRYDF